jgi:hypothetical protein
MSEQIYLTGDEAFKAYGSQKLEVEDHAIPRGRAIAYTGDRTFVGHDTNISVKSDYNWKDYDYFRPSQSVPARREEIMAMCMTAYKKVGLVKNVIDLMGDFGAQGIRVQHPNTNIQQFYNTWWEKVQGAERSERFLNNLYRCGNLIIKKSYGTVSTYQEKTWKKGTGKKENEVSIEKIKTNARQIPLKYKFINPLAVEVVADDLAQFVGAPALGLKISPKLRSAVNRAQQKDKMAPQVKKMLEKIPKDVLTAIKRGDRVLPLDPDKIEVYYYKKDDWDLWADPMCYCILDDLLMLNQLKLADRSALDGAISNIRLWQLGIIGDSPATSILPTKTAINKLRNILANNVGGGTMDLVWGPELKFEESNSQVWRWLGSEKYDVTISAIYEGLGIPAPLRAKTSGSTNTSSYVGLNTLIKRLQYGRDRLVDFWNKELKYIHKAMGFAGPPPQIIFDFMALADEAAEKQLLINLWDRDIISDDTILELFGRLPSVEKSRVKHEHKERIYERMPYKASPFHNPDKEDDFRKILLQSGGVAPSEIGIDLQDRKPGEIPMIEKQQQLQLQMKEMDIKSREKMNQENKKAQIQMKRMGTPGRPKNKTETTKRKPKPTSKPSTRAFIDIFMWANSAQQIIADNITPALLHAYGKKDLRSLSKEEFQEVERIKFNMLAHIEPFEDLTSERLYEALIMGKSNVEIDSAGRMLHAQFMAQNGRAPNIKELHQIYSSAYALYHE